MRPASNSGKSFEGAAFLRYHTLRPNQSPEGVRVSGISAGKVQERLGI